MKGKRKPEAALGRRNKRVAKKTPLRPRSLASGIGGVRKVKGGWTLSDGRRQLTRRDIKVKTSERDKEFPTLKVNKIVGERC